MATKILEKHEAKHESGLIAYALKVEEMIGQTWVFRVVGLVKDPSMPSGHWSINNALPWPNSFGSLKSAKLAAQKDLWATLTSIAGHAKVKSPSTHTDCRRWADELWPSVDRKTISPHLKWNRLSEV